jgi:hypothetical protein
VEWLWADYLPLRNITLFSGTPKAGKTTLFLHLLRSLSRGDDQFLGIPLRQGKVLIVTQESPDIWQERMERDALSPNVVHFLGGQGGTNPRPFMGKARPQEWFDFCAYLVELVKEEQYQLVVIDPIADFWPVRDENNAGEVTSAVSPLRAVADAGANVLLIHHNRKAEGKNGQAARGSTALPGFADVLMDLRRGTGSVRILTATGRLPEPPERHIELTLTGYVLRDQGTGPEPTSPGQSRRGRKSGADLTISLLPTEPPGMTVEELLAGWPQGEKRPSGRTIRDQLKKAGIPHTGTGKAGDPYCFYRTP